MDGLILYLSLFCIVLLSQYERDNHVCGECSTLCCLFLLIMVCAALGSNVDVISFLLLIFPTFIGRVRYFFLCLDHDSVAGDNGSINGLRIIDLGFIFYKMDHFVTNLNLIVFLTSVFTGFFRYLKSGYEVSDGFILFCIH